MRRDIYTQSVPGTPSTAVTKHETVLGIFALAGLLGAGLFAGNFLLFHVVLPLLDRASRTMRPDEKIALVEGCIVYCGVGALVLFTALRARRLRQVVPVIIAAAIIMPAFALGFSLLTGWWGTIVHGVGWR
jgi:hypothetical protein